MEISTKDQKYDLSKRTTNKYDIVKKLGAGAFGQTFLVKRIGVDGEIDPKLYVLKQLKLKPTVVTDVFSEIAILQKITKYGCRSDLLCFYEYFVNPEEKTINIVTEAFQNSTTLADFIREYQKNGSFIPRRDILIIYENLISSLVYLHKIGIAHGDIKPENILIDNGLRIQLIDFGISCSKKKCVASGTLLFAAPEILKLIGSKNKIPLGLFEEADIFSMGMVFYLLANLEFPFSIRGGNNPYQYDIDEQDTTSLVLSTRNTNAIVGDSDITLLMSLDKYYKSKPTIYSFYNYTQTKLDEDINNLIEQMLNTTIHQKSGRPSARRILRTIRRLILKYNELNTQNLIVLSTPTSPMKSPIKSPGVQLSSVLTQPNY